MRDEGAVVLLSGGQDSTTCLAWAKGMWDRVHTLAFDYSQKHSVELKQAAKIADLFGVESHTVLPVEALKRLGHAALTDSDIEVELEAGNDSANYWAADHGLPSTFVPGRNMIFFTLGAAHAAHLGHQNIVTGVCEQDRAGYPDCRAEFVEAAQEALSLALDDRFLIHAPLLQRSKAETWALADELGILDVIVEHTHTCYHGERSRTHPWGAGCGECPACDERRKGFEKYISSKEAIA